MISKRNSGFTIIELLAVVSIIAVLSSIAVVTFSSSLKKAKIAKAISDITIIYKALLLYEIDEGGLPSSLDQLVPVYLRKIPLDPWGENYRYLNFNVSTQFQRKDGPIVPINTKFDLYSLGPDRKTTPSIRSQSGRNDIIVGNDGEFIGVAEEF